MKLSEVLKQETASLHKEVETTEVNRRILSSELSISEYGKILQAYYRAFKSQEEAIAGHNLPITYIPRVELLEEDLENLSLKPDCPEYLNCNYENSLQALGAMYVLTGSNEGARFILKRVLSILGEGTFVSGGISFFSAFKQSNLQMSLVDFKNELDVYASSLSNSEKQEIIEGAKEAFVRFKMIFSDLPH